MIRARGRKRKRSGAFRFHRPTPPPVLLPPSGPSWFPRTPPVPPGPSRSPPVPMSRPDAPGVPGSRYPVPPHPAGSRQQHPLYRTSNQAYGSRAPTVHEVPTTLHVTSHAFSNTLAQCGMYRDNGLNTYLEKSRVTGPDNFITPHDTLNFHPSYNARGPSHC